MVPSYRIAATGRERRFEIVVGLQEGYSGHGRLHDIEEVDRAHQAWQTATGLIQGATITQTTVSYGFRHPADGLIRGADEPVAVIAGAINVLYDADTTDDEARNRILSLAQYVGGQMGQQRVYVTFDGQATIYEAVEHRGDA